MKKYLILLALIVAACAQPERTIETPSGRPEATYDNTTAPEVAGRIANGCASLGKAVVEMTDNRVVCESQLSTQDTFLAELAIGNAYSTPPQRFSRFTIFPTGGGMVKVQLYQWIETQLAFGQTRRIEYNSNNAFNAAMAFLRGIADAP